MDDDCIPGNKIFKFRLILLGNQNVGKTSLLVQFINNIFSEEYFPTKDIVYVKIKLNLIKK